jgi:predicted Fe-Mo cluster-binding NifX family protein
MKIAVTYENGMIFQHFGHTEQFKIYETENGAVKASEVVSTNGAGHGALAGRLKELGVEALICGGLGGGARQALGEAGITVYPGAAGTADGAVEALLAGRLSYDPDTVCHHHDHEGGEHHCGDHGCGGHGEEHHHCGS